MVHRIHLQSKAFFASGSVCLRIWSSCHQSCKLELFLNHMASTSPQAGIGRVGSEWTSNKESKLVECQGCWTSQGFGCEFGARMVRHRDLILRCRLLILFQPPIWIEQPLHMGAWKYVDISSRVCRKSGGSEDIFPSRSQKRATLAHSRSLLRWHACEDEMEVLLKGTVVECRMGLSEDTCIYIYIYSRR